MGGSPSSSCPAQDATGELLVIESLKQWKSYSENAKKSKKLIVLDFTAGWCGPCRLMKPVIKEFASKYKDVIFVEIDVDKLDDVAHTFEVREMPTYVLIKEGKEVARVIGAMKNELKNAIEKHRNVCS